MAQVIVVVVPDRYDQRWMSDFALQVQQAVTDLSTPVAGGFTITNAVTDRAYDANSTTVEELADVLATLIDDLQTKGVIE